MKPGDADWPVDRKGRPVPARADGKPNLRHVTGKWRTPAQRRNVETFRERFAELGPQHLHRWWHGMTDEERAAHTAKASKAAHEAMTPEQRRERGRKGGQAVRARAALQSRHRRWGESGISAGLYVESRCELRVVTFLRHTRPGAEVRRYMPEVDGEFPYDDGEGQVRHWNPDLVVVSCSVKEILEIKFLPGYPTRVSAEQVQAATPETANRILLKSAAHPQIDIWNGASDELIRLYDRLDKAGKLPEFVKDE